MAKNKKRKKTRSAKDKAITSLFLEGLDSYTDEYRGLLKTPSMKGLATVTVLPADLFNSGSYEEQFSYAGVPYTEVLMYSMETNEAPSSEDDDAATGFTCAMKDGWGKVRPAIFLREFKGSDDSTEESRAVSMLAVLLHELGHAEDILKEVNYCHEELTLDISAAEGYAHNYLIRKARSRGYRLLLGSYLDNLVEMKESDVIHVSSSAAQALNSVNIEELTAWSRRSWMDEPGTPQYKIGRERAAKLGSS